MRRGRSSAAASSSNVLVPVNAWPGWSRRKSSTHSGSRFQTATGTPRDSMFRARLRPIVPRPMTPNRAPLIAPPPSSTPARTHDRATGCAGPGRGARSRSRRRARRPATVADRPAVAADSTHLRLLASRRCRSIPPVSETRDDRRSAVAVLNLDLSPGRPTAARSASTRANSDAAARSDASMHRCVNEPAASWTSGKSKNCAISARQRVSRVQRTSLNAARSRFSMRALPARLRRIGVEHDAVGQLDQVAEHLDRSATPPDHRRQARQPQRGHRIVDEVVRQAVEDDDVGADLGAGRVARPLRDQDAADRS